MGWLQVDGYSNVGDVFAEEAVVLGAVLVAGVDVAGQAALVDLMPAGGDHHHDVVVGQHAAGQSVAETDLAQVRQLPLLHRRRFADYAQVDVLLVLFLCLIGAAVLLEELRLLLLDLSHLQLPLQLGRLLALALVLGLFLVAEVVHEYPDDDDRVLREIILQHRRFVDLQDHMLQPFIASFSEDYDK